MEEVGPGVGDSLEALRAPAPGDSSEKPPEPQQEEEYSGDLRPPLPPRLPTLCSEPAVVLERLQAVALYLEELPVLRAPVCLELQLEAAVVSLVEELEEEATLFLEELGLALLSEQVVLALSSEAPARQLLLEVCLGAP